MAPTLAITHLTTTSRQARQQVIDSLTKVANFAQDQEPDVIRYAITTPQVEGDDVSIYVIEECVSPTPLPIPIDTTDGPPDTPPQQP